MRVRMGLAAGLFFVSMSLFADAPAGITAESAVEEALAANLGLKVESKKLEVKARDKDWAFQKFFPTVTAGAGWMNYVDVTTQKRLVGVLSLNPFIPDVFTPDSLNFGAVINAQFVLSLSTFASLRQSLADWDLGRIDFELARQKLAAGVRKTFYQILALRETRKLLEKQVETAEARFRQIETEYRGGSAPELSLLQAQIALETRRNDLRSLGLTLDQAHYAFSRLLGRPPVKDLPLEGVVEPPVPSSPISGENLAVRYLEGRWDLGQLRSRGQALEATRQLVVSQALPQIALTFTADPVLNGPQNKDWFKDTWVHNNSNAAIQIQWKLDVFLPGSAFWTQLADLDTQRSALALGEAYLRDQALAEILGLADQIQKSTLALESLKKNAQAAERASGLAQAAFSAGVTGLLDVQEADLQAQGAQLALLNEKLALIQALIDLETALNIGKEEIRELF